MPGEGRRERPMNEQGSLPYKWLCQESAPGNEPCLPLNLLPPSPRAKTLCVGPAPRSPPPWRTSPIPIIPPSAKQPNALASRTPPSTTGPAITVRPLATPLTRSSAPPVARRSSAASSWLPFAPSSSTALAASARSAPSSTALVWIASSLPRVVPCIPSLLTWSQTSFPSATPNNLSWPNR